MSDEGLIASMTFPGSLNTDSFLVFIEQVLLPQLWAGAIVVMDNLSVHYATVTTNLIESVGALTFPVKSKIQQCKHLDPLSGKALRHNSLDRRK